MVARMLHDVLSNRSSPDINGYSHYSLSISTRNKLMLKLVTSIVQLEMHAWHVDLRLRRRCPKSCHFATNERGLDMGRLRSRNHVFLADTSIASVLQIQICLWIVGLPCLSCVHVEILRLYTKAERRSDTISSDQQGNDRRCEHFTDFTLDG